MSFLFNLLESATDSANTTATVNGGSGQWFLWGMVGLLVLFLVYTFISGRKRNKKMEEERAKRNDIHPGYKVTTIGAIMGTVVEVDDENNTFVLKTGTEENPSYIKFDKQAIYASENPFEQTATENPTSQESENATSEEVENATSESEDFGMPVANAGGEAEEKED